MIGGEFLNLAPEHVLAHIQIPAGLGRRRAPVPDQPDRLQLKLPGELSSCRLQPPIPLKHPTLMSTELAAAHNGTQSGQCQPICAGVPLHDSRIQPDPPKPGPTRPSLAPGAIRRGKGQRKGPAARAWRLPGGDPPNPVNRLRRPLPQRPVRHDLRLRETGFGLLLINAKAGPSLRVQETPS
jgi:hypothetical protein